MIVDPIKLECIRLLIEGWKVSEIAKEIGVSRRTIYNWMDKEEFKATLNESMQQIKQEGENAIIKDLVSYIDNIKWLAIKSKSEKIRLDASTYLVDRVLGKSSSRVEITDDKKEETNIDVLSVLDSELNKNKDSELNKPNKLDESTVIDAAEKLKKVVG